MLQAILIGHIGADAITKNENGREFTTFRVAHSERWEDEQGNRKEQTTWVDCIMNGKPAVADYLRKGQLVFISGSLRTRVYSSAKDRCMKAGITISVRTIELLGSKPDAIPAQLISTTDGTLHNVTKWYYCADLVRDASQPEAITLTDNRGANFIVDRNGFVSPLQEAF